MELLIMAAGMGSRFGGLKQLAPMGPNGEFIIDYSIFDAIKTGFSKIVFIIKEENYEDFKETIGKRVESHIPVEYVFQKINNIPSFVQIPEERIKPWGTAHAIYCAKDVIKEPFVVINSDDFYGCDAYKVAKDFIEHKDDKTYGLVGYEAINTITENGSVNRGVFKYNQNRDLERIIECSIKQENNEIYCEPLDGSEPFKVPQDTLVSMNMLIFDPSIFSYIEKKMETFFINNQDNLNKCEFLIPDIITMAKNEEYAKVKVLHTKSKWYGVTYKEDTERVQNALLELTNCGEYPNNLWKS